MVLSWLGETASNILDFGGDAIAATGDYFQGDKAKKQSDVAESADTGHSWTKPWTEALGTLGEMAGETAARVNEELPNYFLREAGIIPEPGDTVRTRYVPVKDKSGEPDGPPQWAKYLLQQLPDYEPAQPQPQPRQPDSTPIYKKPSVWLAVGAVVVFFLIYRSK
jgi:hypothetical protein